MERVSSRTNRDNSDPMEFPPPPPYTSVVFKLNNDGVDADSPPTYTGFDGQPVVYINNYPGPPLTDGCVEVVQTDQSVNLDHILPKKVVVFLFVNGIVMLLLGFACVGVQIGIITSHAVYYYYYGFWAGAFLMSIGVNSTALLRYRRGVNYVRLFHTFFWQMLLVAVILGIGIAILVTENCNSNEMQREGVSQSCESTHETLNGCLLGIVAAAFGQSIMSATVFYTFKKRHILVPSLPA